MLSGSKLVRKLIDLDGAELEEIIFQCGYFYETETGEMFPLACDFEQAVSSIVSDYIAEAVKAHKKDPENFRLNSLRHGLVVKKLTGHDLLAKVASIDSSFEASPPWDEKKEVILECGYLNVDKDGRVRPSINDFHDAYLEAEEEVACHSSNPEEDEVGSERNQHSPSPQPLHIASYERSQQVISPNADDEIGKAVVRAVNIARTIQNSYKGNGELTAIQVGYFGCGDDGSVDSVDYLFSYANGQCQGGELSKESLGPPKQILFNGANLKRREYEEMIKEDVFSIANNCHGAWANDAGGGGLFVIYIDRAAIYGEHVREDNPYDPFFDEGNEISPYCFFVRDV